MTYQSSPYFPVLFPDEAYRMNRVGVRSMRVTPTASLDIEVGTRNPWLSDAVRMVHAGLETNKRKEQGMLGHINTTSRSQRYALPASRSSIHNGRFPGMEYSSAGLAFRGGAMCGAGNTETPEGRRYIQDVLLKRRIEEYANLKSGIFSETATTGIPPPMNPETVPVDVNITQLQDLIASGTVPSRTLGIVKSVATSLYKIGEQLTASQISKYLDVLTDMWRQILEGYDEDTEEYQNLPGREQRLVPAVTRAFERIGIMLELFAQVATEPIEIRMKRKAEIRNRFLDLLEPIEIEEGSTVATGTTGRSGFSGTTSTTGNTGASSFENLNLDDFM